MRFKRFLIRPSTIPRTNRRIKNAERAIQRELDSIPLFPELVRFHSTCERLDYLDNVQIRYWQDIRDFQAQTWRKFRRRFYSLPKNDQRLFLDAWNSSVVPGEANYASDTLTNFFKRDDWRKQDISSIQSYNHD